MQDYLLGRDELSGMDEFASAKRSELSNNGQNYRECEMEIYANEKGYLY